MQHRQHVQGTASHRTQAHVSPFTNGRVLAGNLWLLGRLGIPVVERSPFSTVLGLCIHLKGQMESLAARSDSLPCCLWRTEDLTLDGERTSSDDHGQPFCLLTSRTRALSQSDCRNSSAHFCARDARAPPPVHFRPVARRDGTYAPKIVQRVFLYCIVLMVTFLNLLILKTAACTTRSASSR